MAELARHREDRLSAAGARNDERAGWLRSVRGTLGSDAPWGNSARFCKDFGCSKPLVNSGKIVSRLDVLEKTPAFET